jgi:hypothetical protein
LWLLLLMVRASLAVEVRASLGARVDFQCYTMVEMLFPSYFSPIFSLFCVEKIPIFRFENNRQHQPFGFPRSIVQSAVQGYGHW